MGFLFVVCSALAGGSLRQAAVRRVQFPEDFCAGSERGLPVAQGVLTLFCGCSVLR
jgi:hypothetical protein